MESVIIDLMRDCGVIDEEMAKVIKMQSEQMQSQMGDINQNIFGQNNVGGVLPGSNPMELLQNQQRQQSSLNDNNNQNTQNKAFSNLSNINEGELNVQKGK